MKLEIENDIVQGLDSEALALVDALSTELAQPKDPVGVFRPNYFVSAANLTGKQLPFNPVHTGIDIAGNEVARFFSNLEPPVGFAEQNHKIFIELCQKIQRLKVLEDKVSITFVVEAVFDWIKLSYQKLTSQSMMEHLISVCFSEITDQEIWIPIAGTEVETEVDMGKVNLRAVMDAEWRRWVIEWNVRQPAAVAEIKSFFSSIGTKRTSVAVLKIKAEPVKAVEIAIEEVDSALAILRYFSPANFNPSMYTHCTISGKEYVERPRHILLKSGILTVAGSTESNMRWRHPWKIDASLLSKIKARGFDTLVRLNNLAEEQLTDFQNYLIRALNIYSKSSLAQNLSDKLLYIVVALEYLLLKNNIEPLQKNISERMALLIGRSLDERLIIIKNYKEAYALRSAAVHHGADLTESQTVEDFMKTAWWTLNKLIEYADRFQTKEEMINYIDDIKFT